MNPFRRGTNEHDAWERQDVAEGVAVLDDVHAFLGRFVAYPTDHAHIAHTLWIIHTHLMDVWDSTPRIAFLSPEPGSGKSRALEVTELLVPRAVQTLNTTVAYLFRKISDEDGAPTLLFDEVDTVFTKQGDNEDVRALLNGGHRRGAVAGRCVVKGKEILTVEMPSYCAVALAGLGDLPDTILTRSVIVRMRRRAPGEWVEPFRRRIVAPEAKGLYDRIVTWSGYLSANYMGQWPEMPDGIEDRNADVWEALLAVADAAGGDWPKRGRVAAVALVADVGVTDTSLGVRLLRDLHGIFGDLDAMSTEAILAALVELDEAPWADLRGKPMDARGLATRLGKYGVKSKTVRIGTSTPKGYTYADLYDPFSRYLGGVSLRHSRDPSNPQQDGEFVSPGSATSATSATPDADLWSELNEMGPVGLAGDCGWCGKPTEYGMCAECENQHNQEDQ